MPVMPNVKAEPIHSRVSLLIYSPIIEQEGGRKLNQVLGWNDPDSLCQRYIQDVREASHGIVQYQIVERIELDAYPMLEDGFRYTDAQFLRNWHSRGGWHQPQMALYPAILRDAGFVAKLEGNQTDELWVFGFPYAGFYESCMGGHGAIWCNGPVIPETQRVARRFVVMGFNYERGVGEMLEDLGHRAENIMEHMFRDVPDDGIGMSEVSAGVDDVSGSVEQVSWWEKLLGVIGLGQTSAKRVKRHATMVNGQLPMVNLSGNLWRQFIRYDQSNPGAASCGNVHFAPSSQSDYDWGNTRSVLSNADDWLNYPDFTGGMREVYCADWGNGDIRLHHLWWMKRFPHVAGQTPTGKPNNWWGSIIDPNSIKYEV